MNPAFEPTAVMGDAPAEAGNAPSRTRLAQAAAIGLAIVALPLSAGSNLLPGLGAPMQEAALACAGASALLLRWMAGAQRRQAAASGLVDTLTGLYNRRGLIEEGGQVLRQCRESGRPASLVVFDFEDLAEVRGIYGREVSRKLLARVVRKMAAVAGSRGIAARTGKSQFTVLMPGVSRERAQALVQRVLGKPSRVEFDAGDSEIVLVPDIGVETAAAALETVDELYREVAQHLAQQRAHEMRRQHWLQRERERHSRPMSLPAALDTRPPHSR